MQTAILILLIILINDKIKINKLTNNFDVFNTIQILEDY